MSWFPDVGDSVGRYRLTEVLGRGGMGVVFVGVAPDLDRPVAVKVLAADAAVDPRWRERFAREAATLARLDSPHVVYILEYGEHDGCPYLVTQLVPGGDLRRYLDEHGALSPRRAAAVIGQVAAALDEAHSHGIVHRDLKSANVLLRLQPGDEIHAYLCDFGIAGTDTQETTAATGVIGTLEYLAPERQSGAPASPATDVYALGCLLWAAVTGSPPYRGSDVELAVAHLRAPIPRLPGEDPVSRALNGVVARAMAKKPEDRYATARDMREDLLALAAMAAEQEPRPPTTAGPRRWWRRAGTMAAVGVAGVAVLLSVGWLALTGTDDDQATPRAAVGDPSASSTRCWDGTVADADAACTTPSGIRGLEWVYPGFKRDRATCHRVREPLSPRKVLAFFCPFTIDNPEEGIRYSEWASAGAAHQVIARDFRPWLAREVQRGAATWSVWVRESADETGWFSSAVAYRDWPYSAEVQSNTRDAAVLGCDLIVLRSPATGRSLRSLCGSAG